jgi:hypothetical protein
MHFTSVPIWLVAIAVAAAAPFCVRFYATTLEKRVRQRTERALATELQVVEGPAGPREQRKSAGG